MSLRAPVELLIAASLWGFGFVATIWAMRAVDPFEMTFLRFFVGTAVLLPLCATRRGRRAWRGTLSRAWLPGVLLAATLLVQTWGLKYTTATKSGFITTLYVVFVPFLESFLDRKRLPRTLWLCVVISLVGTVLIVNAGISDINPGDLLTLVCAVLATLQIYILGKVSPREKNPFLFNWAQSLTGMVVCLPFAFNADLWRRVANFPEWPATAQAGMLSLAFGSTVIAFALQVRAQARLSATVSSLLFLMESPFAMFFAVLLLGERLGPLETAGAGLIFLSAVLAIRCRL